LEQHSVNKSSTGHENNFQKNKPKIKKFTKHQKAKNINKTSKNQKRMTKQPKNPKKSNFETKTINNF